MKKFDYIGSVTKNKHSLLTEQVLDPGVPSVGYRVYGCDCNIPTPFPEPPGWPSGAPDWATTYPLIDGVGRVYTFAEYIALPQIEKESLNVGSTGNINNLASYPVGTVGQSGTGGWGVLICPGQIGGMQNNVLVNCGTPQDGQIINTSQIYGGAAPNLKIAHNGVIDETTNPPPMKNFIPSSCPSGGGTPELAPPACSGGTYNDHLQDPPSPPEDPCKQFMIDYPTIQDQKTFCKKECIGSANPMCKCCKELK